MIRQELTINEALEIATANTGYDSNIPTGIYYLTLRMMKVEKVTDDDRNERLNLLLNVQECYGDDIKYNRLIFSDKELCRELLRAFSLNPQVDVIMEVNKEELTRSKIKMEIDSTRVKEEIIRHRRDRLHFAQI